MARGGPAGPVAPVVGGGAGNPGGLAGQRATIRCPRCRRSRWNWRTSAADNQEDAADDQSRDGSGDGPPPKQSDTLVRLSTDRNGERVTAGGRHREHVITGGLDLHLADRRTDETVDVIADRRRVIDGDVGAVNVAENQLDRRHVIGITVVLLRRVARTSESVELATRLDVEHERAGRFEVEGRVAPDRGPRESGHVVGFTVPAGDPQCDRRNEETDEYEHADDEHPPAAPCALGHRSS